MNVWLRRFSRTFLIWTCVATPSAGSLFRKYVSHQGGTGFYKLLLWLGERAGKVALDVEFTNEFVHYEDGDNDLTLHQGRSGKITWIFCNIMHDHGLPACGCGPAESGVEGNASVGRKAARERPDQQDAGVRRIDEIKPYPVITSHLFVQTLRDTRHDGLGCRSGFDKTLKFLQKFFVHRHSVFGPRVVRIKRGSGAPHVRLVATLVYADCHSLLSSPFSRAYEIRFSFGECAESFTSELAYFENNLASRLRIE